MILLGAALVSCSESEKSEPEFSSKLSPSFTCSAEGDIVAGETYVNFVNTTEVEGTEVTRYFWHFGFSGEGNWSEDGEPDPVLYKTPGEYTVKLTVWGADGCVYVVGTIKNGTWNMACFDCSAVDSKTLKTAKWTQTLDAGFYSSGASLSADGGTVYVITDKAEPYNLYALNASTGAVKWSYTLSAQSHSVPAIDNLGQIHFCTMDGVYHVLKDAGTSASVVYEKKVADSIDGSPTISSVDGASYFVGLDAAALIIERAKMYNPKGMPSVLVGDMNADPSDPATQTFLTYWSDSRAVAPADKIYGPLGTFQSHSTSTDLSQESKRIDWIFVNGEMTVKSYKVDNSVYGTIYPSDHCPVKITAEVTYVPDYVEGKGTQDEPYLINSASDWNEIASSMDLADETPENRRNPTECHGIFVHLHLAGGASGQTKRTSGFFNTAKRIYDGCSCYYCRGLGPAHGTGYSEAIHQRV